MILLNYLFLPLSLVAQASSSGQFGFDKELKSKDVFKLPAYSSNDDAFAKLKPVKAKASLSIGSDCGKINIEGTLKSSFENLLGGDKYFKGLVNDIIGAAPMLTACYFSPTWCSILKHTQLTASFMTQTRLNQCEIIDKYTDSRSEDYYRERQSCVHKSIQSNSGNMESALETCQSDSATQKLTNWDGDGQKGSTQELISDSAQWAGLDGKEDKDAIDLLKAIVGETRLENGQVDTVFGSRQHPFSLRSYVGEVKKSLGKDICGDLSADYSDWVSKLPALKRKYPSAAPYFSLKLLYGLRNATDRMRTCESYAEDLSVLIVDRQISRAYDLLSAVSQNPNLPPNRKQEIKEKRELLRDQMALYLNLEKVRDAKDRIRSVIEESEISSGEAILRATVETGNRQLEYSNHSRLFDCSDSNFCDAKSDGGDRP